LDRLDGSEAILKGVSSMLNFMNVYQLAQVLLGYTQTDGQHNDLLSLTFLFNKSRIKRG
jgi:hypothetical protein